jgi:hypothetical protein
MCIETMRKGIANVNSRISLGVPLFRAILADLLLRTGHVKSAIEECDKALIELDTTGQRFFGPSIYYVKATCSRKLGRVDAGGCLKWYERSVSAARDMEANLLVAKALNAIELMKPNLG